MNRRGFFKIVAAAAAVLAIPVRAAAAVVRPTPIPAAPEVITSTIGPGGDYESFAAWEAATDVDLVGSNQCHVGEMADYPKTPQTVAGSTTDPTRHRELRIVGN